MGKINYVFNRIEDVDVEDLVDKSKIFGSPVFPEGFCDKYISDNDFFVGQINLSELSNFFSELPDEGMLYFFLDVSQYPYVPKVIYSNEELYECLDDFNEGFESMVPKKVFYMDFKEKDVDDYKNYLLGDLEEDEVSGYDTDGLVPLLVIDSLSAEGITNLGAQDGVYYFLIKPEDLANKDFSRVEYIAFGS